MKILPCILIVALAETLNAGPIKDMAVNDPDGTISYIETASYPNLLQFVRDAYTEYKAENEDSTLQYFYLLALNGAASANQIPLATDFSLAQADLTLKGMGARAIWLAMLRGTAPTSSQRQAAISKLKAELTVLSSPSQEALSFARYASNALLALGDDAGLDIYLTDKEEVGNDRAKDNWTPASPAIFFQNLATQYTQLGNDSNIQNNDVEKKMATVYLRAKERRDQGKEVKVLTPLANLDNLKRF